MNRQHLGLRGKFSPPIPFKNVFSDKRGSVYYDLIIKSFVIITLLATVLSFLSIFTTYLNLSHICRRIVRVVELEGEVSNKVYDVFYKLKEQTALSPEMTIEDVTYCDEHNQKIQLRNTFTVKLKYNHIFTIFKPSFSPPVQIVIPMQVRISGMSERYWKVPDSQGKLWEEEFCEENHSNTKKSKRRCNFFLFYYSICHPNYFSNYN